MSEEIEALAKRLRREVDERNKEPDYFDHGVTQDMSDAADIIEEQAARIAELESALGSKADDDAKFEADWIAARKGVNYFDMAHVLSARLRQMDKRAKASNKRADASQARLSEAVKVLESVTEAGKSWNDRQNMEAFLMISNSIEAAKAFIATIGENKNEA